MGPVPYPKEIYGIVSYLIFSMLFYITFKMKTLACGSQVSHMWVRTSGLLCGSVGQVDQQAGMTHFQPWFASVNFIKLIASRGMTPLEISYACPEIKGNHDRNHWKSGNQALRQKPRFVTKSFLKYI